MAWHLGIADVPGRPYAVVDGTGQLAGCHATRAAATIQMTALNEAEAAGEDLSNIGEKISTPEAEAKSEKKADAPVVGVPWEAPAVSYTTPTTLMW